MHPNTLYFLNYTDIFFRLCLQDVLMVKISDPSNISKWEKLQICLTVPVMTILTTLNQWEIWNHFRCRSNSKILCNLNGRPMIFFFFYYKHSFLPFRLLKSEVLKLALLFRAVIELNCLKKLSDKNITRFIKPKLSNRRLIFHFSSERCLHEPGPQTVSRSESFTTSLRF